MNSSRGWTVIEYALYVSALIVVLIVGIIALVVTLGSLTDPDGMIVFFIAGCIFVLCLFLFIFMVKNGDAQSWTFT